MIYDAKFLNKIKKDRVLAIIVTILLVVVYISLTLLLYFNVNRNNERPFLILVIAENIILLSLFCVSLFAYLIPLTRKETFIKRLLSYKSITYVGIVDKISDISYYINGTSFKVISLMDDRNKKDFYLDEDFIDSLEIGKKYLINSNNDYIIEVQDEIL